MIAMRWLVRATLGTSFLFSLFIQYRLFFIGGLIQSQQSHRATRILLGI